MEIEIFELFLIGLECDGSIKNWIAVPSRFTVSAFRAKK